MNHEENVLRIQVEVLEKKIKLMRELSNTNSFYQYYFRHLSKFNSNKDCFEFVNEQYHELYGVYRYADYGVFRAMLSRHNKKK